ncbi:hypothetical protein ACNH6C_13695 [Bdellovibrio bacteriovorus]|uniref:hypothetical protein n=1 Tax=Bdellovibrio bacteriovorus TaxID=959 RepID=UPI003A80F9A8
MAALLMMFFLEVCWGRESLYKKPEPQVAKVEAREVRPVADKRKAEVPRVTGNLDAEFKGNIIHQAEGSHVVLPASKVKLTHPGLRPGDALTAVIEESLIAFPDSKIPVRARIVKGPLKDSVVLGEASLEKNSKRITIEFKRFLARGEETEYAILAQAHDSKGVPGVEGEYVTEEKKFFMAEFFAAFAAGMADASIRRSQNAWGNYVEEPGMDTTTKSAGAAALSKSADRLAERARSAEAYAVLQGPIVIKVLVLER